MEIKTSITPKSRDEFMLAMTKFAESMHKDMRDVIVEQSGLACFDAIVFTPPMLPSGGGGNSNPAKKLGEYAVKHDINSVFEVPKGEATSFQFFRNLCGALYVGDRGLFAKLMNDKRAQKTKNGIFKKIVNDSDNNRAFGKMKNLLANFVPQYGGIGTASYEQVADDLDAIHERLLRTANGRKIRDRANVGLMGYNKYVVESQSKLKAFIKKKMDDIGKLKAGWAAAMKTLPAKANGSRQKTYGGTPAKWITRHGFTNGYCDSSMNNRESMFIRVGNRIGDNDGVATEANTPNIVYGNRVKQMEKNVRDYMNKNINKFNNRNN